MEIAAIVDDHSHECTNEECQEKVANPAEREIGFLFLRLIVRFWWPLSSVLPLWHSVSESLRREEGLDSQVIACALALL